MAGGGNSNPMTEGTPPVQTYGYDTWTPPQVGQLDIPGAPGVSPVPMDGLGVNTGIPQGGYAAPAIEQYMTGVNTPTLSYVPGQHDTWLGDVAEDVTTGQEELANRGRDLMAIGDGSQAKAAGSHLRQDYYDQQVNTIRNELGWNDYDPTKDVIAGTEYEDIYRNSAAAQQAADTLYSNAVGIGAGNSLESGKYSGANFGDSLHSGLEHISEFSPILGFVNEKVSDYRAPVDNNRSDDAGPRSSMEIAIDRETKNYADSGKVFDMNDPSTWSTDFDDWDSGNSLTGNSSSSNKKETIGRVSENGHDAGEGFEWVDSGGYLTRTWVGK